VNSHFERMYYENPELWSLNRYLGDDRFRVEYASSWLPADVHSVLDVGCGNGIFIDQLGGRIRAFGTDRSFAALKQASYLVCQSDAKTLPFADESFDAVVCMEVIEHLPQATLNSVLGELLRVARKYILISVPYRENLRLNIVKCPNCDREFHRAFHMRSFERADLVTLFDHIKVPARPKRIEGIHRKPYPFALSFYLWLKRHGRPQAFRVNTICPHCGYQLAVPEHKIKSKKNDMFGLSAPIKWTVSHYWPRIHRNRWWMALYCKG